MTQNLGKFHQIMETWITRKNWVPRTPYCKGSGGSGNPWLMVRAAKAWMTRATGARKWIEDIFNATNGVWRHHFCLKWLKNLTFFVVQAGLVIGHYLYLHGKKKHPIRPSLQASPETINTGGMPSFPPRRPWKVAKTMTQFARLYPKMRLFISYMTQRPFATWNTNQGFPTMSSVA